MQVSNERFRTCVLNLQLSVNRSGLSTEQRYEKFADFDPFDKVVPPSLLNAGHLATYALLTGMIEPFDVEQLTKPATYLVSAEGPVRYVNEKREIERFYLTADASKKHSELQIRDVVRLAPNSVCYLTLAPTFRMPSYIGARFNLLIRDVYRGLLVGTGPLVDPGFYGKLSIPIHNFTSNEYLINAGEGLVYFEFTKLGWKNPPCDGSLPDWVPQPLDDQPPFPASKKTRRTLDDYLKQATGGGPPASSIGEEITKIRHEVEHAQSVIQWFSAGGAVAAVVLGLTAWQVYIGAQQFVASAQTELRDSRPALAAELRDLRTKVDDYKRQLSSMEEEYKRRLDTLEAALKSEQKQVPQGSQAR